MKFRKSNGVCVMRRPPLQDACAVMNYLSSTATISNPSGVPMQ